MFRDLLLLVLLMFQSTLYAQVLENKTVILEANEAPPFFSKKLPLDGMAGEIIHAISKVAGINSKIIYKPLSRNIADDTNNDLGNPAFFIVNQDFAEIIPIALYHISLYYYAPNHKNKIVFKSLNDLRGLKIGVLKGTLIDRSYFEKNGVLFEESYIQESLFKKLRLGRLDAVIEIELVASQIIKRIFPKEIDSFRAISISNSSQPIAIMIAEENSESIAKVYCKGLRAIIKDGSYQNILNKYYDKGKIPNRWFEDLQRFGQLYNSGEIEYSCLK